MWLLLTILVCVIFAVTWLVAGYSFIVAMNFTVIQYLAASLLILSAGAAVAYLLERRARK